MSIVVNIGMWFERYVIIVTSIHRDYDPSSWGEFHPTSVDVGIFIGTLGIFFTLFLAFFARPRGTFTVGIPLRNLLRMSGISAAACSLSDARSPIFSRIHVLL